MKEWILESLSIIERNNCDALLLGGFSGSVIELLGRCLCKHTNDVRCFEDFLEDYLPKYYPYLNVLYGCLRCEGAHAILAQNGVMLSCEKDWEEKHLKYNINPETKRHSLFIYSPVFVQDLKEAINKFMDQALTDVKFQNNINKVHAEIFSKGQKIIKEEIDKI